MYWIISLLLLVSLHSEETPQLGSLSSTHASYDGDALTLTGKVNLAHTLGQMTAEKALLTQPAEPSAPFPFTRIELHRGVLLALTSHAELRCAHADLNFATLKGIFHAEDGEKVSYEDLSEQDLRLTSRQIELSFTPPLDETSTYTVHNAFAHQDVEIQYNHAYTLFADRSFYTHTASSHQITAYAASPEKPCRILHHDIELLAHTIQWDLSLQTLDASGPVTVDQGLRHLICYGSVHFDHAAMTAQLESPLIDGTISKQLSYTDPEMTLYADQAILQYALIEDSWVPTALTLNGNVRLSNPTRCAIADHLHYTFDSRSLILSADPDHKVLFVDDEQSTKISASEVQLIEDPLTKIQTIKGIGNIRVAFDAEENALLHKLFPHTGAP